MRAWANRMSSRDVHQHDHRDDDAGLPAAPRAPSPQKKRVNVQIGRDGAAEMQERATAAGAEGRHSDRLNIDIPDADENEALLGGAADPSTPGSLPAMDAVPRVFRASWPSALDRVMFTARPLLDVWCFLAFFLCFIYGPEHPLLYALRGNKFLLFWLPFLYRTFTGFVHFLLSLAVVPGPLIYNEGPLRRMYPKWLLDTTEENFMYRELSRPRLEACGGTQLQLITPDGVTLDAMFWRGANASFSDPVVVRFNGNAEAFELHDEMLPNAYNSQGLNYIMFNYRGVGRSRFPVVGGSALVGQLLGLVRVPCIAGTALDAWTVLEYVVKGLRVPPQQVVLLGHSIGGAIAVNVAARNPQFRVALCNSRSFAALAPVAMEIAPAFLGLNPGDKRAVYLRHATRALFTLSGMEFNCVAAWRKVQGFKWVEFSGLDHIIPYALSLHASLKRGDMGLDGEPALRTLALIDIPQIDNHNRMLFEPELMKHLEIVLEAVGYLPEGQHEGEHEAALLA